VRESGRNSVPASHSGTHDAPVSQSAGNRFRFFALTGVNSRGSFPSAVYFQAAASRALKRVPLRLTCPRSAQGVNYRPELIFIRKGSDPPTRHSKIHIRMSLPQHAVV